MTRIIGVIGGKGGIGKTTLVSNLSCALANLGQNVIAVDANMTTPNLGLHLGLHLSPRSLHDVLKGKTKMQNAMYNHPSGFKVVPGSMSTSDLQGVDIGRLPSSVLSFYGKADFVILDSGAGLGREAMSSMQSAEEILVLTNPDLPSVADAMKTVKVAEDTGKRVIGVVVNKVGNKSHEITTEQIEKMLGHRVISVIPDDQAVPRSISKKVPVCMSEPGSKSANEFNRLAHFIVGKQFSGRDAKQFSIIDFLAKWVRK